jgi:hypothetical protein
MRFFNQYTDSIAASMRLYRLGRRTILLAFAVRLLTEEAI